MASKTSQRILPRVKKVGKKLNGLRVLAILREEIDADWLASEPETVVASTQGKREIILSAFLLAAGQPDASTGEVV